jgi:hypothetical protein
MTWSHPHKDVLGDDEQEAVATGARLAGITTIEAANEFLRTHYIGEFNRMLSKPAAKKTRAFGKGRRKDLEEVFSIQTERTVGDDNTVVIRDRHSQLDRTPFCRTLSGCAVTICEHLDNTVSVRWGPHVLRRFDAAGQPNERSCAQPRGKGGTAPTTLLLFLNATAKPRRLTPPKPN